MNGKELINEEVVEGFKIRFYALEEYLKPKDSFMDEDLPEILDKLDRGLLVWFCAEVTASRQGIELASDYLGGCCYESAEQFCNEYKEYYYRDMVNTVIEEAKNNVIKLTWEGA